MNDAVEIWEEPQAEEIYMIAGWRQWADAGSISSGLPRYLIDQTGARKIGVIRSDDFYLFQIPGTHELVRPVVRFDEGYPETLQARRNELYYAGDDERGLVIFLGEEPHHHVERYVKAVLDAAEALKAKRIVGLGGVYGELPYDKERSVSCIYSLRPMRGEIEQLAVTLSDYHGGASIGSYMCRRAGDRDVEYAGFYGFVPTYDFSNVPEIGNAIRLENDFMAWLGIMRRVNHMLRLDIDLSDLQEKSEHLVDVVDDKVEEMEEAAPQWSVRDYMDRLSEEFDEMLFEPLDEVWEDELRRLFDGDDAE